MPDDRYIVHSGTGSLLTLHSRDMTPVSPTPICGYRREAATRKTADATQGGMPAGCALCKSVVLHLLEQPLEYCTLCFVVCHANCLGAIEDRLDGLCHVCKAAGSYAALEGNERIVPKSEELDAICMRPAGHLHNCTAEDASALALTSNFTFLGIDMLLSNSLAAGNRQLIDADEHGFDDGDTVTALWHGTWYPGTILGECTDGQCEVAWEHGDDEEALSNWVAVESIIRVRA